MSRLSVCAARWVLAPQSELLWVLQLAQRLEQLLPLLERWLVL
ncbi:MAG TPA: hypothetical protein VFK30_08415 [Anaerolineae bacterium]|nr:hypothetical protein [Anaerolineae bacterium]